MSSPIIRALRTLPIYVVTGKTKYNSFDADAAVPAQDTGTLTDAFGAGGALGVTQITDITGLVAWKDYVPVQLESGRTVPYTFDANGYLPIKKASGSIFVETDPYFSSVKSLLHLDGANGSTTFTDVTGKVWTARSTTALSTAQARFGTASLSCPTGGGITTPDHDDWNVVSGDFTVEGWGYPTSNSATMLYSQYNASGWSPIRVEFVNGLYIATVMTSTGGLIAYLEAAATVSLNAWSHWAFTRESSTYRLWVNGVKRAEASSAAPTFDSSSLVVVGGWTYSDTKGFIGYLDEFRFTKGVCRYTADFTPRSSAFPDQ